MYATLTLLSVCNTNKWFDKKFVLAFYNYLLKIELNCDKENYVNFKHFLKDVVKNHKYVLIYSLTKCILEHGFKESCVQNILLQFAEKYPWLSFLLKKLQHIKSSLFLTRHSAKYNLLAIYEIFNSKYMWTVKFDFNKDRSLIKTRLQHSCEYCEIFKKRLFQRTFWTTAS